MIYHTNDLRLPLPGTPFSDQTLNILKFPDLGSTLVITRGVIADGHTLESTFAAQLTALAQTAPGFQEEGRTNTRIGQSSGIDAIESRSQFMQGEVRIHQYQLACLMPAAGAMLALTYARTNPLEQRDADYWALIKQSIELAGA